jgi:hypothetical protein
VHRCGMGGRAKSPSHHGAIACVPGCMQWPVSDTMRALGNQVYAMQLCGASH